VAVHLALEKMNKLDKWQRRDEQHWQAFTEYCCTSIVIWVCYHKMLSYRRETALQGALVLAKSGRLKLGHNILRTL